MDVEFWATTDVGRVRDHNEDNFLVDKRMRLFVVCDGMGGHAAGEVASAMSVQIVREVINSHREVFERLEQDPESLANRKNVLTLVEHAITEACSRIYHAAREDMSKKGMGTTCSLLLLAEGRGFIGHVGDSRIYLSRQAAIHQITEDHSLINEMIRLGKIKKGEEHNLPHKNAVTRAVGVNEFVEVDTWELDVFEGDCFLLCSDGLSGYFKNEGQIAELVDQEDLRKVTQDCIDFANAGGGKDNITAIAVRVREAQKRSQNIQRQMEVMRANPIFRYLNYKEMVQVVNLSESESVNKDEWVYEAGEDPGAMFLIVEGSVGVALDGSVLPLGPGEVFGELAMIDETVQEVGAKALDDCQLLVIQRDRFMGLLRSEEGLAVKLLWNFLQIWTFRLRQVPYHVQRGARPRGIDEPTPPSGNLAFEDDRKEGHQPGTVSGEFDAPNDPTEAFESEPSPRSKAQTRDAGKTQPIGTALPDILADDNKKATSGPDDPASTQPQRTAAAAIAAQDAPASIKNIDPDMTVPDNALAGLEWDDIIPPDLLDDSEDIDSLRKTQQMSSDEETKRSLKTAEELRETVPDDPSNGLSKPISGTSTTKSSTPRAQVLRRTKLVVGKRTADEATSRDMKTLRAVQPDSTMELDIDDDSVEEVN